jgi:hypothetical protein
VNEERLNGLWVVCVVYKKKTADGNLAAAVGRAIGPGGKADFSK